MKKIYLSDGYIIIEDGTGIIYNYPAKFTVYDGRNPQTTPITNLVDNGIFSILTADVGNWFDEGGVTAYSYATLINFLKLNTAI